MKTSTGKSCKETTAKEARDFLKGMKMSILENLEMGGLYLSKKQFQIELEKIWRLFPELEKRKKQNAGKLSGGENRYWPWAVHSYPTQFCY